MPLIPRQMSQFLLLKGSSYVLLHRLKEMICVKHLAHIWPLRVDWHNTYYLPTAHSLWQNFTVIVTSSLSDPQYRNQNEDFEAITIQQGRNNFITKKCPKS